MRLEHQRAAAAAAGARARQLDVSPISGGGLRGERLGGALLEIRGRPGHFERRRVHCGPHRHVCFIVCGPEAGPLRLGRARARGRGLGESDHVTFINLHDDARRHARGGGSGLV